MVHLTPPSPPDVICLSHLRWNFVFQRPQHLMTRCARDRRVFFVEEPVFDEGIAPHLQIDSGGPVAVVVPHLPADLEDAPRDAALRRLLDELIARKKMTEYLLWY